MVKYAASLDSTFHALADSTRRSVLEMLQETARPLNISELARPHAMSFPAISKHLKVLEQAGLVKRVKYGRSYLFHVIPENILSAQQWMNDYSDFWNQQLDSLEKYLERKKK